MLDDTREEEKGEKAQTQISHLGLTCFAAVQQFKHFKQSTYLLNVNIPKTGKSMVQRPECA